MYLRDDLKKIWTGKDIYVELLNHSGEVYRCLESRKTFRFKIQGSFFFAKIHFGLGWVAVLLELLRGRIPVLGAETEWLALNRLLQLGVSTMTPVAFGQKGCNPVRRKSYLVTEELKDMVSLEDVCSQWSQMPPGFLLKFKIINKLAKISKQIHDNGINHRDYYLCHFYIPKDFLLLRNGSEKDISIYIIDLHRAQLRSGKTPDRWRIKDISGLYYSALDCGLTKRDLFRFIRVYTDVSLRKALRNRMFWQRVTTKAMKLRNRMLNKGYY